MSYYSIIEVVQGDHGYELNLQLTKKVEGTVFILIGATMVEIVVYEREATNYKIKETCTVTDGLEGKIKYTVQDGDFDEAKLYKVDVVATFSGRVETAKGLTLKVKEKPPVS